jgi:hypothetical protein
LPERFGPYQSVKRRYYRWIEMGVLDEMLSALIREADLEWLMIGGAMACLETTLRGKLLAPIPPEPVRCIIATNLRQRKSSNVTWLAPIRR